MHSKIARYLDRYAFQASLIDNRPREDLGIVVVVPCYDEPGVLETLQSLADCAAPKCSVEIIVVINHPGHAGDSVTARSDATFEKIKCWITDHDQQRVRYYVTKPITMPSKHAGVGLARKIGMDEAVWRFHKAGKTDGLIANLDADCTCASNYLVELHKMAVGHRDFNGCSIYFEHPIGPLEEPLRRHIIDYELHLRYHRVSLSLTHYPYAFHTVGSAMAVGLRAYTEQGGMNRKKAGEDFYFLHKIFPLGGFYTLNSTTVYPKARLSDKVPFGTGAALTKMAAGAFPAGWMTYNPEAYCMLDLFLSHTERFFHWKKQTTQEFLAELPECILSYLNQIDALMHILRIREATNTKTTFTKAFFRWFDGLKTLRYFNHASRHFLPDKEVGEAAAYLIKTLTGEAYNKNNTYRLLLFMRQYERSLS